MLDDLDPANIDATLDKHSRLAGDGADMGGAGGDNINVVGAHLAMGDVNRQYKMTGRINNLNFCAIHPLT